MDLDEFVKEYEGQHVVYKKYAWVGASCVALFRWYTEKVTGLPQSDGVAGAADLWKIYPVKYYNRIAYAPGLYPKPGDIAIWKRSRKYRAGHVAIAVIADAEQMTCLSQNDPTGDPVGLVVYDYDGVDGWWEPKSGTREDSPSLTCGFCGGKLLENPVGYCRRETEHLSAQLAQAREAIAGILADPHGCPMCDSGVLRNPEKQHWPDCPYAIARAVAGR